MDTEGTGSISYDEFTLLTEEKFRKLDPFEKFKKGNAAYNNKSVDDEVQSPPPPSGLIEKTDRLLKLE